jgi:hypothetical protein
VYRNAGIPLSPTKVRERLRAIGVDLSNYSNEMAAIHTVLRRLNASGELRAMAVPGKQIYSWRTPTAAYAIGPELAQFIREHGTFHMPSGDRGGTGASARKRSRKRK